MTHQEIIAHDLLSLLPVAQSLVPRCGSVLDGEDLVNETFLKLSSRSLPAELFNDSQYRRRYFIRAMRNEAVSLFRAGKFGPGAATPLDTSFLCDVVDHRSTSCSKVQLQDEFFANVDQRLSSGASLVLEKLRRGHSIQWLAGKLDCSIRSAYRFVVAHITELRSVMSEVGEGLFGSESWEEFLHNLRAIPFPAIVSGTQPRNSGANHADSG